MVAELQGGAGFTKIFLTAVSLPQIVLLAEIILIVYTPAESNRTFMVLLPGDQLEGLVVTIVPNVPVVTVYLVPGVVGVICQMDLPEVHAPFTLFCPAFPVLVKVIVSNQLVDITN